MSVYYEYLKNTSECQSIPSQLPGLNGQSPEVTDPAGVEANLESWKIILIIYYFRNIHSTHSQVIQFDQKTRL